jgi:hypothetical protein
LLVMRSAGTPSDPVYVSNFIRSIEFVELYGVTVILFLPQLELPYDIKSCVRRLFGYILNNCEVDVDERAKLDRSVQPLLDLLKSSRPEVLIFDQNDLFCDGAKCSLMRNGIPLLRDEYGHLSEYGSVLLGELFAQWAKANAPGILR